MNCSFNFQQVEFSLFETKHDNLKNFFNSLARDEIWDCCYDGVYSRGEAYYKQGAVMEIAFYGTDCLKAMVRGNLDYKIRILLSDGKVSGECSCPFGGICKHLIATLLFACDQVSELEENASTKSNDQDLRDYLNTLSKKELIGLVDQFAPDSFRQYISNRATSVENASTIVEKVRKKIDKLFLDEELLWNPADMEQALVKQFKKLSGLGDKQADSIGRFILEVIREVSSAQDQGYLYDSYYDQVLEDDELNQQARALIKSMPLEKRIAFLKELEDELKDSSYDTFTGILDQLSELFTSGEQKPLKNIFLTSLEQSDFRNAEGIYTMIASILNEKEKEHALKHIGLLSSSLALQYAEFCEQQGAISKALEVLVQSKNTHDYWSNQASVLSSQLRLSATSGDLNLALAVEALNENPTKEMLELAASYLPSESEKLEEVVKDQNGYEFLEYLEAAGRLKEAVQVVLNDASIWEESKFSFFKKYKKQFPNEAGEYFRKRIDENLQYADNTYYQNIRDSLKALKVIDSTGAREITENIKLGYKRRRNLMAMLERL